MNYKVHRGTQDILPAETWKWQKVEDIIKETCDVYRYKEIRTPIFEQTELFQRLVGDTTDIVQKEMYTFTDKGDRSLTLRPEGTAPVVRSFVEHKMFGYPDQPVKLYYTGPMFRYERQQAGRYRQFVQFGIEAIGSDDPAIDAEVISLALDVYKRAGLSELKLVINSLGDTDSRKTHKEALVAHFSPHIEEFCSDCQSRLEKNPLRILDCKIDRGNSLITSAPSLADYLNEQSAAYFEGVKSYLDDAEIVYEVDANLVRGLDYYNHTAFEIMSTSDGFGAITTLCGGGRYNGLAEDIGGPSAPGIGFGMSIERLLLAMEAEGKSFASEPNLDVYIVTLGEVAKRPAAKLLRELRKVGIRSDMDYLNRKMKAQMKSADRLNARAVVLIGEDEVADDVAMVRNMADGTQEKVSTNELIEKITSALTR
jgi:histidyl-tRNA synthetase